MARKRKASPGANQARLWDSADRAFDRAAQPQYTHLPRFKQFRDNPEQYCRRTVPGLLADAFVMLRPMLLSFPARMRHSYFVDRNGCLRCVTERRAAG